LVKGAEAVVAPNEFLRDELRRRFKIEAVGIHNMCDLSVYDESLDDMAEEASEGEADFDHLKARAQFADLLDLGVRERSNPRGA
jgi:hypothetical protein